MGAVGARTCRSLGHHLLHPQILRSRVLFYRTDCTHRAKFLMNTLVSVYSSGYVLLVDIYWKLFLNVFHYFVFRIIKFGHSEKATKIWNHLPLDLTFSKLTSNQVEDGFKSCGILRKAEFYHFKPFNDLHRPSLLLSFWMHS